MKLLILICFLLKVVASQLPPAGGAMMNMATITDLDVICDKTGMTVTVDFSQPFNGIIFSKGYYSDPRCRYVEENSGQTSYTLWISSTECGSVMEQVPEDASRTELSNTIIVQNDKYIQEIWDVARTITCDWVDNYVKTVNFNPFSVGMLQSKEVKFEGDQPIECWMDLQLGKWPDVKDINSIVKIGDALSLLVFARDNDGQYDVSAKDCYAYAGPDFENPATPRLQLTDEEGCVLKDKLISPFYTARQNDRSGSVIVTYAIVNAFKFPDVMDVFMTCNVEICKGECDNKCSASATEAPRRSGSTLFGEPIYTTKPSPFCPPGSTNPECPQITTPLPFICTLGSTDIRCPQTTLPQQKPVCYPGSRDPECRNDSPNRGKALFPFSSQCIPGTNDPNCLSNLNIPTNTLPRCLPGSLDPSCSKTIPTTTELPTTTTQKCFSGALDPDCETATKDGRFGSILFPATITTPPTTTTKLNIPVTVPVTTTSKPKTTEKRFGGAIFGGPITTPKPSPTRPSSPRPPPSSSSPPSPSPPRPSPPRPPPSSSSPPSPSPPRPSPPRPSPPRPSPPRPSPPRPSPPRSSPPRPSSPRPSPPRLSLPRPSPPRPSLKPKITTTTKSPNRGKQLGEPQSKPEPSGAEWEGESRFHAFHNFHFQKGDGRRSRIFGQRIVPKIRPKRAVSSLEVPEGVRLPQGKVPVKLTRSVFVVSAQDFPVPSQEKKKHSPTSLCLTSTTVVGFVLLLGICLVASFIFACLYMKHKSISKK